MKNIFLIFFFLAFLFSLFFIFGSYFSFLPKFFQKKFSLGMDIAGGTILTYQIDLNQIKDQKIEDVLEQTKDLIERRVNFLGVGEFFVSFSKSGRVLIEIPNIKDPELAKKLIGETPFLEFRVPDLNSTSSETFLPTELTGKYLQKAELSFNPNTLEPVVLLYFDDQGKKIFKELTEKYLGKPIAIYLDGKIISAPIVQNVIEDGQAQITGKFTLESAKLLVQRLNQGALPAPLYLISESTLNPLFSKDIINIALKASVLGVLLVIIFMVVFYKGEGLLASIALIFFIVFNLAIYKILGVTISLASLSGFILAVGMAVDANILIFERMKEERKRVLKEIDVVKEGFDRAFSSIRDSNFTTMISSILIYYLATSFVKGFALTLFLGVLISFLTAVFFSRHLLELKIRK